MTISAAMLTLSAGAVSAQARLPVDSLVRIRKYTEWFLSGQIDSVWAHVNEAGRRAFTSMDAFRERQKAFSEMAGPALAVIEERFVWRGSARQYWRTMRTARAPEPVVLRFSVGADGEIQGLGINLVNTVPPIDSGGPVIRGN